MADDEERQQEEGGDERAQAEAQEVEKAKEEMHELEEGDPPEKLQDWPEGKAKYLTYGGPEDYKADEPIPGAPDAAKEKAGERED